MGVPQPMKENDAYSSVSAGDQHLCSLRIPINKPHSLFHYWGYNMTISHEFKCRISLIMALKRALYALNTHLATNTSCGRFNDFG